MLQLEIFYEPRFCSMQIDKPHFILSDHEIGTPCKTAFKWYHKTMLIVLRFRMMVSRIENNVRQVQYE